MIFTVYSISEKLIINNRSREQLHPQGVVIHSTATPGATAQNEYDYFNSAYRGASAHYFVDWTEIIRTIPENEVAWHAGKANYLYLSVEMCEPSGNDKQKFEEIWNRTVWWVADACIRYDWSKSSIYSHLDVSTKFGDTNHTDPIGYLASYGLTWADLLAAIEQEIQNIGGQTGGDVQLKNLILVGYGPDERAAGYLADYLRAPLAYLDAVQKEDLDSAKNIYVIGGSSKPIDRAIILGGADRYATCQKVLDFIQTGVL